MINRFNKVEGRFIEKIYGQDRYGYAKSDSNDFYDIIELVKGKGYKGSEIIFYDFLLGNVYKPLDKKRNVTYGSPIYIDGFLYFLQVNYEDKKINLYKYLPDISLEKVVELNMDEVNLYNLSIIGSPLYIISQESGEKFQCYYPISISLPINNNETVVLIDDGKVYIEAWEEEGRDYENNCATDEYRYYEHIIIKDFNGNNISDEIGCLNQSPNGEWWIS